MPTSMAHGARLDRLDEVGHAKECNKRIGAPMYLLFMGVESNLSNVSNLNTIEHYIDTLMKCLDTLDRLDRLDTLCTRWHRESNEHLAAAELMGGLVFP